MTDIPATQHAIQFTGPGTLVHNHAKAVPVPGPTQLLFRVEAVGICFSDTKLLHAFTAHPRKGEVLGGLDPRVLAEIGSYVPGEAPTVPGHEVSGRIVAVGDAVTQHRVGERCLVQTDYRHLPTAGSNAAFGYNFEGGLQEYVLLDERMILEPGTGDRFLIPVDEVPSGSAVALLEPWACVEKSYASPERRTLLAGGRLLVAMEAGSPLDGLDGLTAASRPREIVRVDLGAGESLPEPAAGRFDDIVYAGTDADHIEALAALLGPGGIIDVVLGGRSIARPVAVDVGRIHYDLVRWVGTTGTSAADGYARIPADGELRDGDAVAVIGAAGPMGFMHVIRAVTLGLRGLRVDGIDIDDARLAHLEDVASPLAREAGVAARFLNSRREAPSPGAYSYVGVMVPAPALVAEAIALSAPGARVNLFAGFAVGTRAALDLEAVVGRGVYLFGTSGSEIRDMRAVLDRLEAGRLDTNVSLDAVCGMEGVDAALAAVEARSSGGKIVVYPALHNLGLVRLVDLPSRMPDVAAQLRGDRWTREAEAALLQAEGGA
ncbi:MAG TPA: alcohol dehydrogenase catalytic domain-containing protein [Candidatus Limnocylindrales bacterium]|nr:alcohol dehydrogenase catalytic domain-containing protein [Candidatus Limnocylindrales bacterium]